MNWYKKAEAATVSVTPEGFGAMDWDEKRALAENRGITPATQRLFFTEKYAEKRGDRYGVLWSLAGNPSITPETQRLLITEKYEEKDNVLWRLAKNESISHQTQLMFFTEEYKGEVLQGLAQNRSITPEAQTLFFTEPYERKNQILENLAWSENIHPEVQRLFFTEKYENKGKVLEDLAENPSFLRGDFTTAQWHSIKNAARGSMRLLILSKRLEQIQKVAADIIRGKLKGGL